MTYHDPDAGDLFPECRGIGFHSRCPAVQYENGHAIRCACECHGSDEEAQMMTAIHREEEDLIRSRVARARILLDIAEADIAAGVAPAHVRAALGRIGLELELAERELNAIETEEEAQP